ncbi:MAG: hypothetical protein OQJ89_06440 [Kangiellaceae bacterium]|nr:hypothetical protein [Kangiellaceae bacterium]MCW9016581.1 hypothetical protein [Kangiellaceae bacterium]
MSDNELGSKRNHDTERMPIALVIEKYAVSLRKLDWAQTPDVFREAFYEHIEAWEKSIEFFAKYSQLRGEMHDVFDEIRQADLKLKQHEAKIWSTWAKIESVTRFYRSEISETKFAYSSNRSGNSDIYLYNPLLYSSTQITSHDNTDNWPIASKSTSSIFFQSRRNGKFDIYQKNLANGELVRLTTHKEHDYLPSLKGDSGVLTYTRWDVLGEDKKANYFYSMDLAEKMPTKWRRESPANSVGVSWTTDGSLAVTSIKKNGETQLYLLRPNGELIRKLTDLAGYNGGANFSPDGKSIVFYHSTDEHSKIGIIDISKPEMPINWLVQKGFNWHPVWSKDGQWIAFSQSQDKTHKDIDIFVIELAKPVIQIPLIDSDFRDSELSWYN